MSPSGVATPHDRSRRRRKAGGGDEVSGRTQIIDAAIASILEVGFYRSSTNEIARRANVSWGALQYHFGTREALLLAVVKELDRRFLDAVQNANVEGDTMERRITSLYRILGPHYDGPTFLVRLQIVLNLQHDPNTSADVMAEVAEHAAKSEVHVRRLLAEAIGGRPNKAAIDALFHGLRGFALSQQFSRSVPTEGYRAPGPEALKLFLRGLAATESAPQLKR
ncbi:MAG: regulatory protein TetR [Actinomycetia bacterium]|nr:regulatory protein TetR [Actinomycetes bacterium]